MKLGILALVSVPLAIATAAPGASTPRLRAAAIDGKWESTCLPIGKNGRHGFVVRLTISRKEIVAISQTYAHSNCDTPTVRIDYRATLAARTVDGDAIDFDQIVKSVTMTANAPDVVEIYNADDQNAGCGFGGGWQLNAPRPVEGRTCAPQTLPLAGVRLYERAWLVGDTLKIGSFPVAWNNTTPDKRPAAPGLLVFHRVTG